MSMNAKTHTLSKYQHLDLYLKVLSTSKVSGYLG